MITRAAKRRAEEEAESNDARRRRSRSPQAGPSESSESSSISAPSSSDIDSEIIDISDDESDDSGDITVVGNTSICWTIHNQSNTLSIDLKIIQEFCKTIVRYAWKYWSLIWWYFSAVMPFMPHVSVTWSASALYTAQFVEQK